MQLFGLHKRLYLSRGELTSAIYVCSNTSYITYIVHISWELKRYSKNDLIFVASLTFSQGIVTLSILHENISFYYKLFYF